MHISTRLDKENTMTFFLVFFSSSLLDKKLHAINIFVKNGHFVLKATGSLLIINSLQITARCD